jgi:polar amino acid transport system substrate-binding protein
MRKLPLLVLLGALAAAAALTGSASSQAVKVSCGAPTLHKGTLTIGTDNPAYPPYFDGQEKSGTGFKASNPYSGKGFESAVAYAVAGQLGYSKANVKWTAVHFVNSYAPGKKPFDFYLAQVSYKPVRAKAVDFSNGYFDVNQAVVAFTSNKYAHVTTVAALKGAKIGVPLGTTSYDYVVRYIRPSQKPAVYPSQEAAVAGLKAHQIDAIVVDFPTAYYLADVELSKATLVGRLPTRGGEEHFGIVLQKGSPLRACVNRALAALKASGKLAQLENTWITSKAHAPFLK